MKTKLLRIAIAFLAGMCMQMESFLTVDKTLWHGTIKFPTNIKVVPPVRIYYAGNKVHAESDNEGHQVSFTISEYKTRTTFFLVIVDHIDFVSECNTVKYLRVPEGRPYKIYVLEFKPNKELEGASQEPDITQMGTWEITQKRLPDNMRIPDDAIIVCYHPNLVQHVEGGNALELPKIVLDTELLNKLTPQELHDASIQFLLSSLHCDSIHANPDAEIKSDLHRKTIIALT